MNYNLLEATHFPSFHSLKKYYSFHVIFKLFLLPYVCNVGLNYYYYCYYCESSG